MLPNRSDSGLPEGFKSYREYNAARKEKKKLKQEYFVQKLEKQKQKELANAAACTSVEKSQEPSTLSIAVPGSILDNAQSAELRTYLAGQIARAACVFKVDEVIVYDDIGIQDNVTAKTQASLSDSGEIRPSRRCCAQLARILQYLECPQYLRKEFFPNHRDLDYAGLLNPLDAPHHMRMKDDFKYREGVVINQPVHNGSLVNVGLLQNVKVDRPLQPGIRVTVEMIPSPPESKRLFGRVVPPSKPHIDTGVYWGYSVRLANSLNAIFTECPYKKGYDVTIGTSERGNPVENVTFPSHQHALVVFGGLAGIEAALEADDILTVGNPALIFDHYLNVCPDQGSRTIRTEEAILIALAEMRTRLKPKVSFKVQNESKSDTPEDAVDDSSFDLEENSGKENLLEHNSCSSGNNETGKAEKRKKRKKSCPEDELNSTELANHDQIGSIVSVNADADSLIQTKTKKKKKKSESSIEALNNHTENQNVLIESVDVVADTQMQSKHKKKKQRKTEDSLEPHNDEIESLQLVKATESNAHMEAKSKNKKKRKSVGLED